jgi:hypothetical protein
MTKPDYTEKDDLIFTNHLAYIGDLESNSIGSWEDDQILNVNLSTLSELRHAYKQVATSAIKHKYVLAFACGGLPPLLYAAHHESLNNWGNKYPKNKDDHELLKSKYHLFPGLSWNTKNTENAFKDFLLSLPSYSSVLVVDCSFTGGAIAKANKLLREIMLEEGVPSLNIELMGIVERDRLDEHKIANVNKQCSGDFSYSINVVIIKVKSLIFEDFPELIGYDSLQKQLGIVPKYSPGVIIIKDTMTGMRHVSAASPMYIAFDALVENENLPGSIDFSIPEENLDRITATALFLVLRDRFEIKLRETKVPHKYSDPFSLLDQRGQVLSNWREELARINKRFNQNFEIPRSVKKIQQDIHSDRELLRGDLKPSVKRHPVRASHVPFSLRVVHTDENDHIQTEYTIMVPLNDFCAAIFDDHPLNDLVPVVYRSAFSNFKGNVNSKSWQALELSWKQLKKDLSSALRSKT